MKINDAHEKRVAANLHCIKTCLNQAARPTTSSLHQFLLSFSIGTSVSVWVFRKETMIHLSQFKPSFWLNALSRISPMLAEPYWRGSLNLDDEALLDFRYKIAESKEDFEQAFNLLKQHESPVGKFHLLPTTQILLLIRGYTLVATMTLVRNNELGLPAESSLDLSWLHLKKNKKSRALVAELTSFVVHSDFKEKEQALFLLLARFALRTAEENSIRYLVLRASAWSFQFCKSILLLTNLGIDMERINGGILDLHSASKNYCLQYSGLPAKKNFFQFMQDHSYLHSMIPSPHLPVMQFLTPDWLEYFSNQQNPVLSTLSDFEKFLLRENYQKPQLMSGADVQKNQRFSVGMKAEIKAASGKHIRLEVQNIGACGLGGLMSRAVAVGKNVIEMELQDGSILHLSGIVMWQSMQGHFGFKIQSPPTAWLALIEELQSLNPTDNKANTRSAA